MSETADLFSPVRLGPYRLANRIVMAPLTRSRAGADDVPKPMTATYYAQRATAGLIISEASQISPQGKGYAWTPGIYSAEQVAGWKAVTDSVHAKGGRIYIQLWHVGRISHPDLQPGGALPVAPAAVRPDVEVFTETGIKKAVTPRALEIGEIPGIVADYRRAAENALAAGFDGIEVHAANGYLLDQFLRDGANKRTDAYGGSVENRVRLVDEVVRAVVDVCGADRVGIRISPVNTRNDLTDSNPEPVFLHLVDRLNALGVSYLHVIEGVTGVTRDAGGFDLGILRRRFKGLTMLNNGYTRELAIDTLRAGKADMICFGRPFISNPDLVERLRRDAPLNPFDPATFYGGDERGYLDYPTLDAQGTAP
ncbi:MAG: alkene reductase [Magnetospirillum sp.]|nr:alkene reductase [Magnetospirillum sp.]